MQKLLEGVDSTNFCQKLEGHEPLLREFSWEAYDIGYEVASKCSELSQSGLFEFNEMIAREINRRELYMVNVEKLAFVQYAKMGELGKPSLIYIFHSMQLCLQDERLARTSTLLDGLGVVLSATSCLIETITTGEAVENDGGLDVSMSIYDILEISMNFSLGLAAKSSKWGAVEEAANSNSPWDSKAADDVTGFTLNLVAHFVSAMPDEVARSKVMSIARDVLHSLRIDLSRLTAVPRSMKAFLFASKAHHAMAFDKISQLEKDEEDGGSQDDAVAIAKSMKLGLCGSGLDDGSQMSHVTGLERALFAHHTDEQRDLFIAYSLVCFEEAAGQEGGGRGKFGMGKVEMVPWRAVSDSSVRSQVKSWQDLLEKIKGHAEGKGGMLDRCVARLVEDAAVKRFPGGQDVEAASWPLLGCAMMVSHSLALSPGTAAGFNGKYSYPVGVLSQFFAYQDLEPLLFALMSHPRIATSEGLRVFTALGHLLPVPGTPIRPGGSECGAADQGLLLPGYTYLTSASGIDTNGYNVDEVAQVAPSPWEKQGQLRKRAFGVNAVVSQVAWRKKEGSSALAAFGAGARSRDLLCVGQLCAASTDSHYIVQASISAIVQAPDEQRAQAAFVALQKRLALFEPRGLCVLLRKLIQECPYGNVTGLLVDVVKSCAQHSSRGGAARNWHLETKLSSRVGHRMRAALEKLNLPVSLSANQFREIQKASLPAFLSQANEVASSEKEQKDDGEERAKRGELGEESFFLAWKGQAPFWSPFWVSTLASSSLHMLVSLSSAQVERELDAIAASVALLLHAVQCIQASQRAIGEEVAARGAVAPANEHLACVRGYLLAYDPSLGVPVEELSTKALLGSLKRNKPRLFEPLLDLLEDASASLQGLIARREKGEGGGSAVLLRLQVLSMNIQSICNLLDT